MPISKLTETFERLGIDVNVGLAGESLEEVLNAVSFGLKVGITDDNQNLIGVLVPADEYLELRRAAGRYQP